MTSYHHFDEQEVIGLLPLAGQATRLSPLPFSKAMYPVGFRTTEDGSLRPKVVCHYLLEKMQLAGIRKAYLILRSGAWDIPGYLEDGNLVNMDLAYLIVRFLHGVPYTLDQAYPFIKNSVVALGFPDILFHPEDGFKHLLEHLKESNSDVVLGVAPVHPPHIGGDVNFDHTGRVQIVVERPEQEELPYNWYIAVWAPVFTEFLHQYIKEYLKTVEIEKLNSHSNTLPSGKKEIALSNVIQAAINNGLKIGARVFQEGGYLDIGTSDGLISAIHSSIGRST